MDDKAIILRKLAHRVGDGKTFIADQPPRVGQAPQNIVDAMDNLATAINHLWDVMRPVVEKFVNDVAPIIAERETAEQYNGQTCSLHDKKGQM
jgi:hypothetical protein